MALSRASQPYREGRDNKGFTHFYERRLAPLIEEAERDRRLVVGIAVALSCATGLAVFWLFLFLDQAPLGIPACLAAGVLMYLATPRIFDACGSPLDLKQRLISKIAALVHPSLKYHPAKRVSGITFSESMLFPKFFDYKGEDYFSGKIGETEIEFSEVVATTRDKSEGRQLSSMTLFRGVFFVADFNKHFRGVTTVFPNIVNDVVGGAWAALNGSDMVGDIVDLEDVDFNRSFIVHSTDQVEARYILTPLLMEKLVQFRNYHETNFSLSFAESRLHMAFPSNRDRFEFHLFKSMEDPAIYAEIFDDIRFFTDIVEQLNLNRRIWSKLPKKPGYAKAKRKTRGAS